MRSLQWYVDRLGRMSLPEVIFRARESFYKVAQGSGFFLAMNPVIPEVRPTTKWIEGCADFQAAIYERAGRKVLAGETPVFALSKGAESPVPQWNRDPLTGTVAPSVFGKSLDLHSEQTVGNIKYLWEQNRHLELVTLAQCYQITGNTEYLDGLKSRLSSWFEQCPYMMGPNWVSGLELAIRLINWSVTWQLINGTESPMFDDESGAALRDRWLRSIYQHVHFVRGNYSRFSSANNHLIGEAAGVFIATCTWPYWPEFEDWRTTSKAILIDEINTQVHPDGVGREQAMSYQQFISDFLILAGIVGRACNREFPDSFWARIERMVEYIQAMMDVRGNMPMIGDADDGLVVRLSQEAEFCPYRSLLASAAILFDRQDFAEKSKGLDDKTRFLFGGGKWKEFSRRSRQSMDTPRLEFPEGGYYVLGGNLGTEEEVRLIVDSGPLGFLSIAAHGHADALSIYLSVAGREFLVDPGTYAYDAHPKWRSYFRGTRAHNTVIVDGADQSVQKGNFMWTDHANAKCTNFSIRKDDVNFIGEHDGYCRFDDPVVHQRQVSRQADVIDILDTLRCDGRHSVERAWHFSERCEVKVLGQEVLVENDRVRIRLSSNEPVTKIVCLRGSENPMGGWVSRAFDVKAVSTSVFFLNQIEGTTLLSTTIQCFIDWRDQRESSVSDMQDSSW